MQKARYVWQQHVSYISYSSVAEDTNTWMKGKLSLKALHKTKYLELVKVIETPSEQVFKSNIAIVSKLSQSTKIQ